MLRFGGPAVCVREKHHLFSLLCVPITLDLDRDWKALQDEYPIHHPHRAEASVYGDEHIRLSFPSFTAFFKIFEAVPFAQVRATLTSVFGVGQRWDDSILLAYTFPEQNPCGPEQLIEPLLCFFGPQAIRAAAAQRRRIVRLVC